MKVLSLIFQGGKIFNSSSSCFLSNWKATEQEDANLTEKFSLDQDSNPGLQLYALASRNQLKSNFSIGAGIRVGGVVGRVPVHRAGDPGSNPHPGDNVSHKLTTYDLSDG